MRAEQNRNATSSISTATPSTTASINILRRDFVGHSLETPAVPRATPAAFSPASSAIPPAVPTRLIRVHRTAPHAGVFPQLARREPQLSDSSEQRHPSKSMSTASSASTPGPTATNAPLSRTSDESVPETQTCAYIGQTSIPKGTAGALFSTLERIFACKLSRPTRIAPSLLLYHGHTAPILMPTHASQRSSSS